jgi:hypothetical protein
LACIEGPTNPIKRGLAESGNAAAPDVEIKAWTVPVRVPPGTGTRMLVMRKMREIPG